MQDGGLHPPYGETRRRLDSNDVPKRYLRQHQAGAAHGIRADARACGKIIRQMARHESAESV